jgi:hypothetical protein
VPTPPLLSPQRASRAAHVRGGDETALLRRAALGVLTVLALHAWPGAARGDGAVGKASPPGKDPTLRETVMAYRVDAKLRVPASVVFDPTLLGHAVLPARVSLTNQTGAAMPLGPRQLDFLARGVLATYPCEVRAPDGDRWPAALEPGTTTNVERTIACDTTLPGAYEIEARFADAEGTDPPLASAPLVIDAGASGPVALSTRPWLRAVATGTRAIVPSREPGRVRMVLGLTNATAHPVPLPIVVIETSLHLRGSPIACKDRREVALTGELGAGKQHVIWMALPCAIPTEGVWEVDVEVGEPSGPPVRLPRHVVHVNAMTTPPPAPPR